MVGVCELVVRGNPNRHRPEALRFLWCTVYNGVYDRSRVRVEENIRETLLQTMEDSGDQARRL
jgi:hypothetical protein